MTRIKMCGVTDLEDARDAAMLGADAIGLNFFEGSPRSVTPERAVRIIESLPPFVTAVGVFVNYEDPQALEDFAVSIRLDAVQLHGNETPDYCSMIDRVKVIKAVRVDEEFKVESLRNYPRVSVSVGCVQPDGVRRDRTSFQLVAGRGSKRFRAYYPGRRTQPG